MAKILTILLALIGVGGGVGAGLMLRPDPEHAPPTSEAAEQEHLAEDMHMGGDPAVDGKAYVKMNNQFVIPVIGDDRVKSLVVLGLSVEVNEGDQATVFSREPKLRDAFLQVLFDHANIGGFDGTFTNFDSMETLRRALLEVSFHAIGDLISDVLITEIVRQDL